MSRCDGYGCYYSHNRDDLLSEWSQEDVQAAIHERMRVNYIFISRLQITPVNQPTLSLPYAPQVVYPTPSDSSASMWSGVDEPSQEEEVTRTDEREAPISPPLKEVVEIQEPVEPEVHPVVTTPEAEEEEQKAMRSSPEILQHQLNPNAATFIPHNVIPQPFAISNETTRESFETPEENSETTQTTVDGSAEKGGATFEELRSLNWLDPPTDAGGSWDDAADLTAWGEPPSVEDDDKVWGSTPAWKMDIPEGGWDAPTSLDDWGTPPKTPTPEDRPKTPRPKTPIPEDKPKSSHPERSTPENAPKPPQPKRTKKGKAENVEKSGNEDRAGSSKKERLDPESSSKKQKLDDDSSSRKQKFTAASSSMKEKPFPKRAVSSGAVVVIEETLVPDTPRRFEADTQPEGLIPQSNQPFPVGIGCIIPSLEKQAEIMEASRKVVMENRKAPKQPQGQLPKAYEPARDGSDWMIGKRREWRPDSPREFSQRSKTVGDTQWVNSRWPQPGK